MSNKTTFELENLVEELILKICKEGFTDFANILLDDVLDTINSTSYSSDRLMIDLEFLAYTCEMANINIDKLQEIKKKNYYKYLEQIADKAFMTEIERPQLYSNLFNKIIMKKEIIYK